MEKSRASESTIICANARSLIESYQRTNENAPNEFDYDKMSLRIWWKNWNLLFLEKPKTNDFTQENRNDFALLRSNSKRNSTMINLNNKKIASVYFGQSDNT